MVSYGCTSGIEVTEGIKVLEVVAPLDVVVTSLVVVPPLEVCLVAVVSLSLMPDWLISVCLFTVCPLVVEMVPVIVL